MKWIPLVLVALLPSVLLGFVTVTSAPASADAFVSIARESMDAGDFVTAWVLYECALRRDPHSPEALAGRLAARALTEERPCPELMVAVH
jgi:hypothetical protein